MSSSYLQRQRWELIRCRNILTALKSLEAVQVSPDIKANVELAEQEVGRLVEGLGNMTGIENENA